MKILIHTEKERAVKSAAEAVLRTVAKNPKSVLGLATGGTMLSVYEHLVDLQRESSVSFASATTFNLDEYHGLRPEHPASYHSYMQACLFSHLDVDPENTHLPLGDTDDPHLESINYEALIQASGGIDFQLLGIGENGHIGFNEPSSSLASRTRVKSLAKATLNANRQYFDDLAQMPKYALTMGVGTILDSRECLLLATGASKAKAVAAMVEGPVSASCPASALHFHPRVTVVLDQDAAQLLENRVYYEDVHPGGSESDV